MPKFTFDCQCGNQFVLSLPQGEHKTHPCPSCGLVAARVWEGFGFNVAVEGGSAPANSGVAKHDYPTADQAVGHDSDTQWAQYRARDRVKDKVRAVGGHRALVRTTADTYVEYTAGTDKLIEARKKLTAEANTVSKAQ